MTLFVSGSLKLHMLPEQCEEIFAGAMDLEEAILVGDAPGADSLFQRYLASVSYPQVEVFYSGPDVRYNLGTWPTHFVDSGLRSAGAAKHGAMDRDMAKRCTRGLMVWDGTSVGTVSNVLDLIAQGKSWQLFLVAEEGLATEISDYEQLRVAHRGVLEEAQKRLDAHWKRQERASRKQLAEQSTFLL